jgi:hypothetical protein
MQFILREKRNRFQNRLKAEKEIPGNVGISQIVASDEGVPSKIKTEYNKLKAMLKYHRAFGPEALLKRKAREKRKKAIEGENYESPDDSICIFAKEDEICSNTSLPLTNYCKKRKFNSSYLSF